MKLETLAILAGIAASVAAVLAYLHARDNTAHYDALQNQVSDNARRLTALERRVT
jgi:hypothetical protein